MIIVMRKDLNMRKGKMVAQGSHAAVGLTLECTKTYAPDAHQDRIYAWLQDSFKKICVSVDSEQELFRVLYSADAAGLPFKLITDAGHTEFDGPTNTCGAIGPATDEELKNITGHLKLL